MLFQRLASASHLVPAKKHRHELVAALADLLADLLKAELMPEVAERVLPGASMDIDAVDQRAVDVEDHGFAALLVSGRSRASSAPGRQRRPLAKVEGDR